MDAAKNRMKRWCTVGLVALGAAGLMIVPVFRNTEDGAVRRPASDEPASTARQRPEGRTPNPASTERGRQVVQRAHDQRGMDFAAAMNAAVQRGDELNQPGEVFDLGYRWVAIDPEAALDFVRRLPFDYTLLLVALTDEWARRDPLSAASWAVRLPEEAGRTRLLASLVAVWAESAPAEAARFAAGLTPDTVQTEALVSAISGWARQDPTAALAWAGQFPPGKLQEQLYTQAVFAWSHRDPVSATEWLRSMPDGKAWDAAASALCGVLAEHHPALALSLATDISDQNIRHQRIENVGRRWLEMDRATAEHALIHSDLPAAFVASLLR
jgi:hypothetical protein